MKEKRISDMSKLKSPVKAGKNVTNQSAHAYPGKRAESWEERIEEAFHNEYGTPEDENYTIEYDAFSAGVKWAQSTPEYNKDSVILDSGDKVKQVSEEEIIDAAIDEYLEDKHPDLLRVIAKHCPMEIYLDRVLDMYHQAKSKEEAEERYKAALEQLPKDIHLIENWKAPIADHILEGLVRLAAFGNEEDDFRGLEDTPFFKGGEK